MLDGRLTPVSVSELARRLECSEKTVSRYIDDLQTYWDAPLVRIPRKGWRYDPKARDQWQVPGLWMTKEESQSLLVLLDILNRFGNGLMDDELQAVRRQVDRLLTRRGISRTKLERKISIVPVGYRSMPDHNLHHVLNALVDGKQLGIRYRDFHGKESVRTVSPQRLVYYRDNWYVDAWCHLTEALRIFSIARIQHTDSVDEQVLEISEEELNAYFKSAYGVFSGEAKDCAVLRFFAPIAQEMACQRWHPAQKGEWIGANYVLQIPYNNPTELIQDILRYLPHVVVEQPERLRKAVINCIQESVKLYKPG